MGIVVSFARRIKYMFFCLLTIIDPKLNTILRYKLIHGRKPNLKHPATFHEKLLYLKLNNYNHNELVARCADKYTVRQYVEEKGFGHMLNDIYGVYYSASEINWDELPDSFVLKWSFGFGYNILCPDKSRLNISEAVKKLNKWHKSRIWLPFSELQYKNTIKRIICERYLSSSDEEIYDYKVYCFHSVPRAILVMTGRQTKIKAAFMDMDWNCLGYADRHDKLTDAKKPDCLNEIYEACKKLSSPFPFVRIDFFVVDNKPIIGEMTFTPGAGIWTSQTDIDGQPMGFYLDVELNKQ